MKNMKIGQYYPVKSFVHSLDPRTKLISILFLSISLFLINSLIGIFLMIIFVSGVIKISNVKLKFILKSVKFIIVFLLFAVILNMLFTPGEVVFSFKFIKITKEGLNNAFYTFFRILMLVIMSSLITLTTSPTELTHALEEIFSPLKKINVPVSDLAMMMTIALRFIPTIMDESTKIINAQLSRGADFESKSIIKKAKSYIPVLVPLFVGAFRRADELAIAMESRNYTPGNVIRTRYKNLKYKKSDYFVYVISMSIFISSIFIR